MTRSEFLDKLREALENDLSGQVIQDNVDYYNSYITEEVKKGRAESEVMSELGDPWVIARSIADMSENASGGAQGAGSYENSQGQRSAGQRPQNRGYEQNSGNVRVFGFDTWWKKLLLVLAIVGVIAVVIAIIGGIFSLLMPLLVPLLLVMLVIRLIGGRR